MVPLTARFWPEAMNLSRLCDPSWTNTNDPLTSSQPSVANGVQNRDRIVGLLRLPTTDHRDYYSLMVHDVKRVLKDLVSLLVDAHLERDLFRRRGAPRTFLQQVGELLSVRRRNFPTLCRSCQLTN